MSARFLDCGDTAVAVEFGDIVSRAVSDRVLGLNALVRDATIPGVVETLPTFRSLMVHYDPCVTSRDGVIDAIRPLVDRAGVTARPARLWRIPACYDGDHAPDIEGVALRTGLDAEAVIGLHAGARYHVYMIGFVPGFPYMGELAPALQLPRQTEPRVRVPPGSIAIATGLTAIYPLESPGGWHLIGRTPIRLFDLQRPKPSLLAPGDVVAFERVSPAEFDAIRSAVASDAYEIRSESIHA